MGGEDFSRYGREEPKVPIFMYRLGSVPPEQVAESKREGGKPLPSLHSALYLPDREADDQDRRADDDRGGAGSAEGEEVDRMDKPAVAHAHWIPEAMRSLGVPAAGG